MKEVSSIYAFSFIFRRKKKSNVLLNILFIYLYWHFLTMYYFTYFILDLNFKYMSFILKFHV
jgi:hypothetical protein